MKKLIAVFSILGLWTTIAIADETPATETTPAPTTEVTPEEAAPEPADCSGLEGEAKTTCEEAQATPAPTEPPSKGKGKLTKSEDNRMESFDEDE